MVTYGFKWQIDLENIEVKTPTMRAFEKDNAYAVDLMLKHGAQLEQSYVKADEGRRVFLQEIADYFNSNKAKELIAVV